MGTVFPRYFESRVSCYAGRGETRTIPKPQSNQVKGWMAKRFKAADNGETNNGNQKERKVKRKKRKKKKEKKEKKERKKKEKKTMEGIFRRVQWDW